jgi:hypothetical protein
MGLLAVLRHTLEYYLSNRQHPELALCERQRFSTLLGTTLLWRTLLEANMTFKCNKPAFQVGSQARGSTKQR